MRVLIADEQTKLRFALRILLEQQPELLVVGEAAEASELLLQARLQRPDLVIVSWNLPGSKPEDLLHALRDICPAVYIVVLSERHERDAWQRALAAGADAFASKANSPARLLSIVQGLWLNWRIQAPKPNQAHPASLLGGR
jgi:DNA-binding NarL/FixJ family response regulator